MAREKPSAMTAKKIRAHGALPCSKMVSVAAIG
jgi:hypothetical protein